MDNLFKLPNGIRHDWILDPIGHYKMTKEFEDSGYPSMRAGILEYCGVLPYYIQYGEESAREQMRAGYLSTAGYEPFDMMGLPTTGSIDEYGVYEYPGDEPLFPLATLPREIDSVHIYPYGLVGIVEEEGTFIYRMD